MRDSLGARHALLSPPPYFFLIIFIISRSRRSKKPSRIQRRRRTAAAPRSLLNYNNKVECNGYLARRSSLTIKLADRWGIKTDEFEIKMLFRYKCAFLTFPVRIWQWNFVHGTTLHPLPFASRKSERASSTSSLFGCATMNPVCAEKLMEGNVSKRRDPSTTAALDAGAQWAPHLGPGGGSCSRRVQQSDNKDIRRTLSSVTSYNHVTCSSTMTTGAVAVATYWLTRRRTQQQQQQQHDTAWFFFHSEEKYCEGGVFLSLTPNFEITGCTRGLNRKLQAFVLIFPPVPNSVCN